MIETCMDKIRCEKIRSLPEDYIWEEQWAKKKNKKGWAIEGMIIEIKKGIEKGKENSESSGIITRKIQLEDN